MKKVILSLLLLSSAAFAYPRCAKELAPALKTVYQFPAGKQLIAEVENDGALQVLYAPFNSNAHALWDSRRRAVVINSNSRKSHGEIVRSIFFELHNAKSSNDFAHLDWLARSRHISKHAYVEAVEKIEHQNAYRVANLINQAIDQGYFPSSSWWPIPSDFATHFAVQQRSGHSQHIAQTYDYLARYDCR